MKVGDLRFLAMPIPEDGATCAEIGVAMGVSAERVRQIEATALRKLRIAAQTLRYLRGD